MLPEFMQPSRWGYFITIIGAGITPGSAWRPLRVNARRYLSMSPRVAGAGRNRRTISRDPPRTSPQLSTCSLRECAGCPAALLRPGEVPRAAFRDRPRPRRACPAPRAESQTHLRARGRTLGKEAWPDRRRHPQAINGRLVISRCRADFGRRRAAGAGGRERGRGL